MKFKKILALLLAALLLTGCAGRSNSTAAMDMAAPEVGYAQEQALSSDSVTMGSGTNQSLQNQKLIKTVNMRAETEDMDALLSQLSQRIAELGGYVEQQETYNGSAYSSYRSRSASLTIRIPAENLDGFVEQIYGDSNVISYSASQDDVTLQYVDTESRMKALQTEQDRLLELLEKAETMSDLLEIEARLTEVRYELESVASQLRVLENQVSYATVYLNVSEVQVLTPVEEQSVWQRIGSGFTENLKDIGTWFENTFVWLITYSPQLLLLIGVPVLVVVLLLRFRRKNRNPQNPETQA